MIFLLESLNSLVKIQLFLLITLGYSEGYLNDPYKVVQRNEDFVITPGISIPVVNIYRENRPDSRFRQVFHQETKHYFESLKEH